MSNIYFKETLNKEFRLVGKFFNRLRNIFIIQPTSMLFNYPIQFNDTLKFKKAVTNESTLDVSGAVTTGSLTTSGTIEATDTIYNGWHGDKTQIKILPSDFQADDDSGRSPFIEDDSSGNLALRAHAAQALYASVSIPIGYKATHCMVYGSNKVNTFEPYEMRIDGSTAESKGLATFVGTELNMTDLSSTTSNYLFIEVTVSNDSDLIYGGYITIEKI